jgi:hypothetical protein
LQPDENLYCTGTGRAATYTLEHVDGRNEPLVHIATGFLRTATNWELNCSGSSYFLRSPDGIKHELGIRYANGANIVPPNTTRSRQITVLYTTKITDANGNFIDIAYQLLGAGQRILYGHDTWAAYLPTSITSSDGRSVTFTSDPGIPSSNPSGHPPRLLSISSSGVTLRQYTSQARVLSSNEHDWLATAIRPDSTKWQYEYWPSTDTQAPKRMKTVTLPTGGSTSYEYRPDTQVSKELQNAINIGLINRMDIPAPMRR